MKKIDLKIFCKNLIDSKNIKDPYDHIDLCFAKSLKIKDIKKIPQKFRYGEYEKKPAFFKDLQFLLIGPLWLLSYIYNKLNIKI